MKQEINQSDLDLAFYKAVANIFAQSPDIKQGIKDQIIQQAIQVSEEQFRPAPLQEAELDAMMDGTAAKAKTASLEQFRLLLVAKKEAGDTLLTAYEDYFEGEYNSETKEIEVGKRAEKRTGKLGFLIHMAINKAELQHMEKRGEGDAVFNTETIFPYLEKLSRSKKVEATTDPLTYWLDEEQRINMDRTIQFNTPDELGHFLKRLKENVYVNFLYELPNELGRIELMYGLESDKCKA